MRVRVLVGAFALLPPRHGRGDGRRRFRFGRFGGGGDGRRERWERRRRQRWRRSRRDAYAIALMGNVSEAIAMYEDLVRTSQRVFGPAHPFTTIVRNNLRKVRDAKVVYGADPLQG